MCGFDLVKERAGKEAQYRNLEDISRVRRELNRGAKKKGMHKPAVHQIPGAKKKPAINGNEKENRGSALAASELFFNWEKSMPEERQETCWKGSALSRQKANGKKGGKSRIKVKVPSG